MITFCLHNSGHEIQHCQEVSSSCGWFLDQQIVEVDVCVCVQRLFFCLTFVLPNLIYNLYCFLLLPWRLPEYWILKNIKICLMMVLLKVNKIIVFSHILFSLSSNISIVIENLLQRSVTKCTIDYKLIGEITQHTNLKIKILKYFFSIFFLPTGDWFLVIYLAEYKNQ